MEIMTKQLLIDFEYNNIRSWKATKVWCVSCIDLDTKKQTCFHPTEEGDEHFHWEWKEDFLEFIKDYDTFIGHNFWAAEYYILKEIFGVTLEPHQVIDTLVWSRLLRPMSPKIEEFGTYKRNNWDTRAGGHGLAAWGKRMNFDKLDFDDFQQYTHEMMTYCNRDTEVNLGMYEIMLKEKADFGFPDEPFELESLCHHLLSEQTRKGFKLDKQKANALVDATGELIDHYKAELHKVFPKQNKFVEVYTPRFNKDGNMSAGSKKKLLNWIHEENDDGTYNLYVEQEFNPSSPQQVGERLMQLGWNPRKYTATGQPSTSKDVIGEAIDALSRKTPEVEVMRKYNIVTDRNQKAKKWLTLAEDDGRVHGNVNHIGPWTHRCSHYEDNMANIARVQLDKNGKPISGLDGDYGWDCRDCWIPSEGWALVGADASGIQLRALAHYMNDQDYIKEVCHGDIHVANQKAAGIHDRPTAKTFIYAWLLGAGDEKIGQIVGATEEEYDNLFKKAQEEQRYNRFVAHKKTARGKSVMTDKDNLLWFVSGKLRSEGRMADKGTVATILKGYFTKKQFLDSLPSLRRLKEVDIKNAANQGYMVGLDGRKIWVPSEHLAMGAYLQGFEAVIMKKAMVLYHQVLTQRGIPFNQVNFVHDEFQIETPTEHADTVGQAVVDAIIQAGEELGSNCPLDGEYQIGNSWAATH
jgi:DNA polymerase I-like protein with 3'-5' exonuclease and polymerase domains